jgi:hypothetical protein
VIRELRVRLADLPERAGRTTATLLASLSARVGALHLTTGAAAVGSLSAGFAALGREFARTTEGDRLRRAIVSGRVGRNGDAIWDALRFDEWLGSAPPAPVLDQLRNDVALLLADDLDETIELLPIPGETGMDGADGEDPSFPDLVLGMYAFSRELVAAVEALASPSLPPRDEVVPPRSSPEPEAELLR